jgi:excisionase family DNA binding protein
MPTLTTIQAASTLKITRQRVVALIKAGKLSAMKIGRDYMIRESDLGKVRVRKPGRPKKKR